MSKKNYEKLLNKYPEYVSLDQLCRICKIAKRSARYLIQNGIIPAIDTGKQTWRYKIALNDVIEYLRRRDEVGSMIPPGEVSSRGKQRTGNQKSFAQIVCLGHEQEVATYFEHIYADYDNVLTVEDVTEMTGLNKSSITKMLKAGLIKSLSDRPKYLIPKQYLLEFVATRGFLEAKTNSEHFAKLLGGFEIWKTAKSLQ
jgi:hypothetical protein